MPRKTSRQQLTQIAETAHTHVPSGAVKRSPPIHHHQNHQHSAAQSAAASAGPAGEDAWAGKAPPAASAIAAHAQDDVTKHMSPVLLRKLAKVEAGELDPAESEYQRRLAAAGRQAFNERRALQAKHAANINPVGDTQVVDSARSGSAASGGGSTGRSNNYHYESDAHSNASRSQHDLLRGSSGGVTRPQSFRERQQEEYEAQLRQARIEAYRERTALAAKMQHQQHSSHAADILADPHGQYGAGSEAAGTREAGRVHHSGGVFDGPLDVSDDGHSYQYGHPAEVPSDRLPRHSSRLSAEEQELQERQLEAARRVAFQERIA
jgi:hypothetical protein